MRGAPPDGGWLVGWLVLQASACRHPVVLQRRLTFPLTAFNVAKSPALARDYFLAFRPPGLPRACFQGLTLGRSGRTTSPKTVACRCAFLALCRVIGATSFFLALCPMPLSLSPSHPFPRHPCSIHSKSALPVFLGPLFLLFFLSPEQVSQPMLITPGPVAPWSMLHAACCR